MQALPLIIAAFQMAIKAAPTVIEIAVKTKEMISALFTAGLISKEKQDETHLHVDQWVACLNAGVPPPEFTVEADPEV